MGNRTNEDLLEAIRMAEASEAKYRNLVENSIQGMTIATGNPLRFIYASPPIQKILGYSPEEMIAFTPDQVAGLIHPEDRQKFFERFAAGLEGNLKKVRREYRIIHKNGETRWVDLFPSITEIDGERAIQGIFVDITERKLAVIRLTESEKTYRELVELAPDAFFHGNEEGKIIAINKNSILLTGYSREELLGMRMEELLSERARKEKPLRYDLLDRGKLLPLKER
ncbi:MAG: PAS domain S-box protein [Bacteroidales bacterium]